MTSYFLHFSRIEKLLLMAKNNLSKFSLDPRRGSRFPKEYSLTSFKKYTFVFLLEIRTQFSEFPKSTDIKTSLSLTNLTPNK